ncbi:MAG: hypothetical protein CRN43_22495 [Candidatus Nephrothrix sp. EaCA]|nr:MAG: hypothetical protein CRN43_22495 [Candidatus Nephrothrix sp. EaCA]
MPCKENGHAPARLIPPLRNPISGRLDESPHGLFKGKTMSIIINLQKFKNNFIVKILYSLKNFLKLVYKFV